MIDSSRTRIRLLRLLAAVGGVALLAATTPRAGAQLATGQGYDTDKPIEITSETLEVQQDKKLAIFTGNVDAVQGELNLKSDKLVVHYFTNEQGDNTISLIEAEGNVVLSSPNERAEGERGRYDVQKDVLELFGSVVITRGNNMVRGEHLRWNLASGHSKMEGGVAAGSKEQRVKAVFVPQAEEDEGEE